MKTLQQEAEALLADVDRQESERKYSRLTPADRAMILRLGAKGNLTQGEIAKALGCTQPTVSRVLALMDTRKEARTILESGAVKLADTVVNTDDAGIALKALGKLDVVREDREGSGATIGPIVILGCGGKAFDGFQDGDRIVVGVCMPPGLNGAARVPTLAVQRPLDASGAMEFPIPADMSLNELPPGVKVEPDAEPLLRARGVIDVTPVRAPEMKILIGSAPPGTPQNPIATKQDVKPAH